MLLIIIWKNVREKKDKEKEKKRRSGVNHLKDSLSC
jgi:hypothetical protein